MTVEAGASPMDSPLHRYGSGPLSSVRGRLIACLALLILVLVAVAGAFVWQSREHAKSVSNLESSSTIASLLEQSEAEVATSALLVQRYVSANDATVLPEIQSHTATAADAITKANAVGTVPNMNQIAQSGLGILDNTGGVLALKQSGKDAEAARAMDGLVPRFHDFRQQLETAATTELAQVAATRDQAVRTERVAQWLAIALGIVGTVVTLAASLFAARSILNPLKSLERTAISVSEGDLSARTPAGGPRELSHLGLVLNHMLATVERSTAQLRAANAELGERNRELTDARAMAATDPLTGLGNHRAFHARIRREIADADASGRPLGLIIFDIDEFKQFNDSLGHLEGDEILRHVARAVTEVVKLNDAYRYGGDEFAVLLPGIESRRAAETAEKLRATLETMATDSGQRVTASLGVSSYPDMAQSAEELIYRADMAMYWAKSTGRNRVGDWDGLLSRRTDSGLMRALGNRDGKLRDAVASLVSALAAKDPLTREHTERCAWYTANLAKELGLSDHEASNLRLASLLHDIGKLAVPSSILQNQGPLNEEEWVQIRQHPTTALHILGSIESVADALPAIRHHHERFDGTGYPDGLRGESIPIASRLISVADAFDAMTTDRPYRGAMPVEQAIDELRRHSGKQFDPVVVEAFVAMIGRVGPHPLIQPAASRSGGPVESRGTATIRD